MSPLLFWPSLSLIVFFVGDFLIYQSGENRYLGTQTLFAITVTAIPLSFIWLSNNYQTNLNSLSGYFWDTKDEFEEWLDVRVKRIFALRSRKARFFILATTILAVITVFFLGLPFKSTWLNILGLMGFVFIAGLNGHAAYGFLDMMYTLKEIASRPVKSPFYFPAELAVSKLQSYYSTTTLLVTSGYILLAASVWEGPYGITPQMQIWLIISAFYPLAMFFWSFFQIHIIMQHIKHANIQVVNHEIQKLLPRALEEKKDGSMKQLTSLIELQDKMASMKEWPIEIQATITFTVTLVTAIIQIVIAIVNTLKP